jgi:hypothetical protein
VRRRIRLLGLGLAVALAVAWGLALATASRSHVTRENYEKIQEFQTRAEVEGILGGPPGDYTRGRFRPSAENLNGGWFERLEWVGSDAVIWVWFDGDGNVAAKRLGEVVPAQGGLWHWLRGLFPW